jgi:antitoxin HicB
MTVTVRVDPKALQYRTEIRPELCTDGSVVYVAEIPDLPGCMSHGATVEDARLNLEDAKREYLAALDERGLEVPAPAVEPPVGGITWTVVESVDLPERAPAFELPTASLQPLPPRPVAA